MPSQLLIKKATEKDITVIHNLAEEIWKAYYPAIISITQVDYMLDLMYSENALRKQLEDGHIFYLAFEQEIPVGYFSYTEKEKGKYFLNKFYIKTNLHRSGTGSQMFNFLLQLLPTGHDLRLTVNRMNYKAINFYFKNGFIIEDAKDFNIGNGFFMNDFVMVRKESK